MNELELKPTYWACVSGGKDSLFMLNLILNNLDKYPLDGVIHYELEIDFPFIKNVIDYMESRCKEYGVPFVRIKPRKSWYDLYKTNLFPTRVTRWCNSKYKMDVVKQFNELKKRQGYNTIYYIGYCYDEFKRYEKRITTKEIYPLVNERIIESDILDWAKEIPIFNEYYKYNRRCGCMYCPLQDMKCSLYLRKFYPTEYTYMMTMALETEEKLKERYNRPISVWQGKPKYDTKYRMKRIEEMLAKEDNL